MTKKSRTPGGRTRRVTKSAVPELEVLGDQSAAPQKIRPTSRRTLRALGGRRVILESFGTRAPTFLAIVAGGTPPIGVWLSQTELQHLVEALRKILP